MARPVAAQRGFTLLEMVAAIGIAALLVAPLGVAVSQGLKARAVTQEATDLAQQARFAMQRMSAAVSATAPHTLSAKAANTTADWPSPVAFCRNASGKVIETTPADTGCAGSRVIADSVSAFSVQSYAAGAGAGPLIEIQLTLSGAAGQGIALTSRTRLGGGVL